LLNVSGVVGGSAAAPSGAIKVKLLDGALGRQRLARSSASLALDAGQVLSMDVELAPADSHGHVKLAGSIDLLGGSSTARRQQHATPAAPVAAAAEPSTAAASASALPDSSKADSKRAGRKKRGKTAGRQAAADALAQPSEAAAAAADSGAVLPADTPDAAGSGEPSLELALSVRDGGMSLLTSLAPGLTWGGGSAALNMAATGRASAPVVTGSASFSKASLATSVLRHPLTQLTGSLALDGDSLAVAGLEAKVGPRGSLAVSGSLPLQQQQPTPAGGDAPSSAAALHAAVSGVELRLRNMYSGSLDAAVDLSGSLAAPSLGGRVVFSRGTAFLVPPASSGAEPAAGDAAASSTSGSSQAELVRTAFAALKAGRARAAAMAADSRQVGTCVVLGGGGTVAAGLCHAVCCTAIPCACNTTHTPAAASGPLQAASVDARPAGGH
jgi:hypothetical protein